MKTYQDLLEQYTDKDRISFIQSAISEHKNSPMYLVAFDAEEYDRQNNISIMTYEKTIYNVMGQAMVDPYSPNHKIPSNFFNRFVTQENQYLLGNGMTLADDKNKERLGGDFDQRLQTMGRNALVQGVGFGFWNMDHLETFKLTEFVPLYDEETGALMAGIRFFQIATDKPLRATLYELDGYTDYIKPEGNMQILNPKRPYMLTSVTSGVDGTQIVDGSNYPGFPIIPMWGNLHHQSELVGLRQSIDAYDLIKSGFANDVDGNALYWVLQNSGGMDDMDLQKFIHRIRTLGVVSAEDADDVNARDIAIPYEARTAYLEKLEQDMYSDFQALNVTDISAGNKTATEINAAYQPFDNKVDQFEYCVLDFLHSLFQIVGIEDDPTFTRNKVAAASDTVNMIITAAPYLDEEYITPKITALLGDPDAGQEILDRKAGIDLARLTSGQADGGGNIEPDAAADGEDE